MAITKTFKNSPDFVRIFSGAVIRRLGDAGFVLGAEKRNNFLYFLKVWAGAFGACEMISIFITEKGEEVEIKVNGLDEYAIPGMVRNDIDMGVNPAAIIFTTAELISNSTQEYMIRGIVEFSCKECGLKFKAPDIEYRCTAFSTPMPCPYCGSMCEYDHCAEVVRQLEEYMEKLKSSEIKPKITPGKIDVITDPLSILGNDKKIYDNEYDGAIYQTITIEDNVEEIGWQGIARCSKLEELTIGASVRFVGYLFCCECHKLRKVQFNGPCPEGLERAFEGCPELKHVRVPESELEKYRQALTKVPPEIIEGF